MNVTLPNSETGISQALDLLRAPNARLVSIFGSTGDHHERYVHYLIDVNSREYRMFSSVVTGLIPSATPIAPASRWCSRSASATLTRVLCCSTRIGRKTSIP